MANRRPLTDHPVPLVLGSLLALGVAGIHLQDQGGLPGTKDPAYLQILYYLLEAAGVVTVALLVSYRTRLFGWLLALLVAASPFIGYVLSRGPGLPGAMDDKGKWGETLGVASLVVEGILLLLTLTVLASRRRSAAADDEVYGAEATGRGHPVASRRLQAPGGFR